MDRWLNKKLQLCALESTGPCAVCATLNISVCLCRRKQRSTVDLGVCITRYITPHTGAVFGGYRHWSSSPTTVPSDLFRRQGIHPRDLWIFPAVDKAARCKWWSGGRDRARPVVGSRLSEGECPMSGRGSGECRERESCMGDGKYRRRRAGGVRRRVGL